MTSSVVAPTEESQLTLVSLFSGAGGLDLGFEKAAFRTIWANDINKDACATHRSWSGIDVVCADIKDIDMDDIPRSNVIAGGFPCQGFSLAGPRKVNDSLNKLYKFFVELVDRNQPDVFVAENVKGILTLGGGSIIRAIVNEFADKGYNVTPTLVNAADYGVPQDRMRVIIVGVKSELGKRFVFPDSSDEKVTLREAIGSLGPQADEDVCQASYSSRYMSRNRRRGWSDQSFTIPAMAKQCPLWPGSPEMTKLSKDKWKFGEGLTRRLSWREAAAIQTFPSNIEFCGSLDSKYKQIGNAVPVRLAEAVARAVKEQIFES